MFQICLVNYITDVNTVLSCLSVSKLVNQMFREHLTEITSEKRGKLKIGTMTRLRSVSKKICLVGPLNLPTLQSGRILLIKPSRKFIQNAMIIEKTLKSINNSLLDLDMEIPCFFGRTHLKLYFNENMVSFKTPLVDALHCNLSEKNQTELLSLLSRISSLNDKFKIKVSRNNNMCELISESGWVDQSKIVIT